MRLLLATNHLGLGGSESYLLTVAEQLDRLGHEVAVYAAEPGRGVEVANERGIGVVSDSELPEDPDAVLAQDAAVSLLLAERYPRVPQVFVAHSESFDLQAPPQLPGIVGKVVALNDRVAARMRSFATEVEVVRMTQPIDTERFTSRVALPETPRRVLLLSNTPINDRLRLLEQACEALDLELTRVGGAQGQTTDPRTALVEADIVVGYGRSILEAMACGRAAYVYDWNGGDGWITPESYPAIEADGIAGRSGRSVADAEKLAEDLRRYSPAMGPVNHDLVIGHHRANIHAQQLVETMRGLDAPTGRPREGLQEMARLVRLEWRARAEVHALSRENVELRDRLIAEAEAANQRLIDHGKAVEKGMKMEYEATASWRLTAPLRGLMRLRRRRRR
ncbi:MAG TPA: hypothetical protein VFY69_00970 [Solirubrobacterales bacterium]|nr:hypothetical protein [Solirubrobacterales bacterium]